MYEELRTDLVFREALMQCALNAITEHRQQSPLALIILFQVVRRKMKRFVWCYLQNNLNLLASS